MQVALASTPQPLPEEAVGIHPGRARGGGQRVDRPAAAPRRAVGDGTSLQRDRDRLGDDQVLVASLQVERGRVAFRWRKEAKFLAIRSNAENNSLADGHM